MDSLKNVISPTSLLRPVMANNLGQLKMEMHSPRPPFGVWQLYGCGNLVESVNKRIFLYSQFL